MPSKPSCADRIGEYFASTRAALELWHKYGWQDLDDIQWDDDDEEHWADREELENIGEFWDYGLSFEYVEPGTFDDQPAGYYRYQMSWGGPSDEFRFYGNGAIDYVFQDWFDGAERSCNTDPIIRALAQHFQDCGMMPHFNGLVRY